MARSLLPIITVISGDMEQQLGNVVSKINDALISTLPNEALSVVLKYLPQTGSLQHDAYSVSKNYNQISSKLNIDKLKEGIFKLKDLKTLTVALMKPLFIFLLII